MFENVSSLGILYNENWTHEVKLYTERVSKHENMTMFSLISLLS